VLRVLPTLQAMSAELRQRVLIAVKSQESPLHDPIEDDSHLGPLVRQASAEAEQLAVAQGRRGMGTCHLIWHETARILRESHRVEWFSPAQMNPDVFFD